MSEPLVSIIIPFFNEEQFLERAVASAIGQTYANIEIILVNDGSTDNSLKIATNYTQQFSHIIVIDALHNSLGKARNLGVEIAKGEYISFLDSDDELEEFAIDTLVAKILLDESDVVVCRFNYFNSKNEFVGVDGWSFNQNQVEGNIAACGMYEHWIASTAWAKLYKTSIVRLMKFPEQLWFEDRPFLLEYFLRSGKVSFEAEPLLKIHSRSSSITRRQIEVKRIADSGKIFLLELAKLNGETGKLERILFRHNLRVLMGNLIILFIDKNNVADLPALQKEYRFWLDDYLSKLNVYNIRLGKRDRLDLFVISLYKYAGWTILYQILFLYKRKKIKLISEIRTA